MIYIFLLYLNIFKIFLLFKNINGRNGDWGLGIGDWGPIPNPQSPIPNPQSPIPNNLVVKLIKKT
jgi:hypothetical protein